MQLVTNAGKFTGAIYRERKREKRRTTCIHATGSKRGKTCNRRLALISSFPALNTACKFKIPRAGQHAFMQPMPSAGKLVTGARGWKTCNRRQARENH